jgi:hypothetical protein
LPSLPCFPNAGQTWLFLRKERDFEAFSFAFQVKIQYTIIGADTFRNVFAASKAFLVGGSVADR